MKRIVCVLMASGKSVRFGENKLLYPVSGKPMFLHALDATNIPEIRDRFVVTIHPEIRDLAAEHRLSSVLHDLPYRSQAIALGMEYIRNLTSGTDSADIAGIMFCPCDQPYLKAESVKKLCHCFDEDPGFITRLSSDNGPGSPVIFPIRFLDELASLPLETGGSYIIKQHLESVRMCHISDPVELRDIDTKADLM